jgi:hypothetical protein
MRSPALGPFLRGRDALDLRSNVTNLQRVYEHQNLSFSTTQVVALQIRLIVRLPTLSYVSKFGAN